MLICYIFRTHEAHCEPNLSAIHVAGILCVVVTVNSLSTVHSRDLQVNIPYRSVHHRCNSNTTLQSYMHQYKSLSHSQSPGPRDSQSLSQSLKLKSCP